MKYKFGDLVRHKGKIKVACSKNRINKDKTVLIGVEEAEATMLQALTTIDKAMRGAKENRDKLGQLVILHVAWKAGIEMIEKLSYLENSKAIGWDLIDTNIDSWVTIKTIDTPEVGPSTVIKPPKKVGEE